MRTELIGTENLPNIYFNSIDVHPQRAFANSLEGMGVKLKVQVKLYDMLNNLGIPYVSNARKRKQKQIMILVSTDERYTEELSKGSGLLTEYKKINFFSNDRVQVLTGMIDYNRSKLNKDKEEELLYNFEFFFREASHIAVFACIVKQSRGRRIESGPVFSELVLNNGQVDNKAFYFVDDLTERIWRGPVHQHSSGKFMAGSFHSNKPHASLRKVNTISTKIKDHRIVLNKQDVIQKPRKAIKEKNSYMFGDLYKTQSIKGYLNFTFGLNLAEIVMSQIKSNKFANIDQNFLYEIAKNTKIKNLKLYYNTDNDPYYKLFCSTKDVDGKIKSNYLFTHNRGDFTSFNMNEKDGNLNSIVEEVVLNEEIELRSFSCQLRERNVKQIKIELSVSNEIDNYFKGLTRRLKSSLQNLKSYEILLQKFVNYDRDLHRTKENFIQKYYNRQDLWLVPLMDLQRILSLNSVNSTKETNKKLEKLFFMLNPKTTSRKKCQAVIEYYTKELTRFLKQNDITKNSPFSKIKNNLNSNKTINEFDVSKVYQVNYTAKKAALNMLPTNTATDKIQTITISTLENILQNERNRYNINQGSVSYSNNNDVGSLDLERYFISPRSIVFKGKSYDVFEYSKISEEYLEKTLDSFNYESDYSSVFDNLYYEKYIEQNNNTIDPVKQLGENSSFQVNLDTKTFAISKIKSINRKITSKVKNIKTVKELFTNSSDKNILSKYRNDSNFSLPIHLRDLVTRDNVYNLDKETFIQEQPHKLDLMYNNLYKINILTKVKADSYGHLSLLNRQIKTLNLNDLRTLSEPTYCFITKYTNEHYIDEEGKFKNFTSINDMFILLPNNWNYKKETFSLAQQNANLSFLYTEVEKSLKLDECDIRTHISVQNKNRAPMEKIENNNTQFNNTQNTQPNTPSSGPRTTRMGLRPMSNGGGSMSSGGGGGYA